MAGEQPAGQPCVDNKLLPVMMEAVVMVQMLLFKQFREDVRLRYPHRPEPFAAHLAGAAINNLFGTQPVDPAVSAFASSHRDLVEAEMRGLAGRFPSLLPLLTDALRMKTICDNQQGVHSIPSLLMAKALGLLIEERDLPMPSTFMLQVRYAAAEHGLIAPMAAPGGEGSPE